MKKKQVEKEQNNEKQLPRQETTLGEDIFQLLLKIVLIILAVILVFTFMYGMARINDVSMKPAIKDGDLVMYYQLDKRFVSGDIAVFKKLAELGVELDVKGVPSDKGRNLLEML